MNNLSVALDCNSNKFKIIGKFSLVPNITSPETPMKDYFLLLIIIIIIIIIVLEVVVVLVAVVIVIAAAVLVALLLVITRNLRSLSYRSLSKCF